MQAMQIVNEPQATNGDEQLWVEFFLRPEHKPFKSEQAGYPIYEDIEMVRIHIPGDALNVPEHYVTEEDRRRFPRQYAAFKAQNSEYHGEGTPIEEWATLARSQVETLKFFGFRTVQQIANASDQQIQNAAPMGGFGLREKAKAWIASATDGALAQRQAAELKLRDNEIDDLKRQVRELASRIEAPEKRGPGRPRKIDTADIDGQ